MKDKTHSDLFAYRPEQFAEVTQQALDYARKLGASDAVAEASEGVGLSVSVRCGDVENVERNRDKSLGISVYVGQSSGSASTSDFSMAALRSTVEAAYDIARFTAADPFAGLPDAHELAHDVPDLDLYYPWSIGTDDAAALAISAETAAFATSKRITNSEGASVSAQQSHFWMANTRGFRGGYAASRHSISVAPIAGKGSQMQRDYWYSSMRDATELAAPETIGRYAAERALARLNARQIPTCECPVLFESPLAAGLLGSFVQAVSGGALYRRTSFLLDTLGQQVFAPHVFIDENPYIPKGRGSSPFDSEGVATRARRVVDQGVLHGYFLGTYSARKLGMQTTGNAGGSHNLRFASSLTNAQDDLNAMLRKLHRGLFVTELIGQGINYVTGDYSRGAAGYWVENGKIAYPVQEITIAGNLKEMFQSIVAIGADAYTYGSKTAGSVLIERMKIAGA
ncbi:metalloprotease PmbA [Saezia sanguinis]|uniref:metalloprotease PmbA n=1 Tax=Saezia sanguinis TaxID=1965230 RepID=UPI00302D7DF3